jgi:beta-glucosidase
VGDATYTVNGEQVTVNVPVTNTGKREGKEVVQLYIRNLADTNGPLKSLRGFRDVHLKPGQTTTATIVLDKKSFEFWDAETNTMRTKSGQYELLYGTSSQDKDLKKLNVNYSSGN